MFGRPAVFVLMHLDHSVGRRMICDMEFSKAHLVFVKGAERRGLKVLQTSDSIEVRINQGILRMRSISPGVVLEITHGLCDQPGAFWLDLYSDLGEVKNQPIDECMDYGLELLCP